jgi:hypothetical protein
MPLNIHELMYIVNKTYSAKIPANGLVLWRDSTGKFSDPGGKNENIGSC